ncbi:MAG: MoaD/ThiS family protein [Chloroflexota bacterium]|nr:MAG: MoaD/ThiS family protein [Chloroflexota bacterium]
MAIEVRIPPVLRKFTGGGPTVRADGTTIAAIIDAVDVLHPGFKSQVTDESGQLHRFINLYRNGEDIRYLDNSETTLSEGDVVAILPAVAGG